MSEWKTYRADEFCKTVTDGTHDSPKPQTCGRYLITSKHLKSSGIDFSSANKISEEDYQKIIKRSNVEQYDILFSMIGTVGNIHRVTTVDVDYAVKNMGIFKLGGDNVKSLWLYYYLQSPQAKEYIKSRISGSTQGYLTLGSLRDFPVCVPPLTEQKRIADVLSAIDDKIELNRRINANLEQQTQALYKSWFVDFEPFGGKMPEDWREGTLGEIAEFRRGKGILGKDTIKGNIPVVAGGLEPAYYHNLANTKAPVVTISASGANAGFMRMYNVDVWASDCSYIDSRCANLLWTYCYLKINAQLLKHAQTGAVQPHVKASDVNAFEIIIPSSENILNFQQKVKPIFDQIANNERENIRLAQLRDTLLPKLMSGEITV